MDGLITCNLNSKCVIGATIQLLTEHFENKIITQTGLFGNKIGPGVLQSRVHQTCLLQECQRHKALEREQISILFLFSGSLSG